MHHGLLDAATVGPFRFATMQRRGRWEVSVATELGDIPIPMKLDVEPPCWLTSVRMPFVPAPIYRTYQFDLPNVPTDRLEVNLWSASTDISWSWPQRRRPTT